MAKYLYQIFSSAKMSDYIDIINKVIEIVKKMIIAITNNIVSLLPYVLRPLYILIIIIGVIRYAVSGLSPKNKRYLYGGILLAIFTELILPVLLKVLSL